MIAPAGILAASVLLWGWQSAMLAVALPLAIVLELWRWTTVRWDIAVRDFQRVADFCTWIFVFETAYFVLSKGWPLPILAILQWLPVVIAPMLVAQLYSSAGRIELSALFLSLRSEGAGALARAQVDLSFPYVVICVLAAGAANQRTPWYFVAVSMLTLWGLWGARSRRYPAALWIALFASAVTLGYAGHVGLNRMQAWLFDFAIEFLQIDLARTDPYRASTDIGHIGELKNSQRILLRVEAPPDARPPILLHRASYNVYASTAWVAREAGFDPLPAAAQPGVWQLQPAYGPQRAFTISEKVATGLAVLALPEATASVAGLGTASLKRNRLGAVRVEGVPGIMTYTALVDATAVARDSPTEQDLHVPPRELPAVRQSAAALGLSTLNAEQVPRRLQQYFGENFRYSTYRAGRIDAVTAISEFLLHSHAGHCEYFATATVLMARAAGIPARYATGFSVQEWSEIEHRYIVRERHAHAWARLYLNGAWRDVDTTPAQWFAAESRSAPMWEPLADVWSWAAYRFAAWRATANREESSPWVNVILLGLIAVLLWRLYRGGSFSRARKALSTGSRSVVHAGADSAFYRIEQQLTGLGLPRRRTETHAEWLNRVRLVLPKLEGASLAELMRVHYRLRFDPRAMSTEARRRFADAVGAWLEDLSATGWTGRHIEKKADERPRDDRAG